jgi:hypothetical protein
MPLECMVVRQVPGLFRSKPTNDAGDGFQGGARSSVYLSCERSSQLNGLCLRRRLYDLRPTLEVFLIVPLRASIGCFIQLELQRENSRNPETVENNNSR